MKLALYCLGNELGTVESAPDGLLAYAGPKADTVRDVVEYYVKVTDLRGDDLMRHVLRLVCGQTRAVLVEEPPNVR